VISPIMIQQIMICPITPSLPVLARVPRRKKATWARACAGCTSITSIPSRAISGDWALPPPTWTTWRRRYSWWPPPSWAAESERAFLYGIAARVAHNTRRANGRRHRAYERYWLDTPEPVPNQEELSDHLRARVLLDAALQEMSAELRGVFVLYEMEGLPVPEIAQRLALPTGTAASRLRRAREAFSDRIARSRRPANAPGSRERGDRGERASGASADRMLGPEILSWWVTDAEVDALRALMDMYRRCHPGAGVVHGGIRGTTTAKGQLTARMEKGAPPDTFQANGGYDLLRWARGVDAGGHRGGDGSRPPAGYLESLEFLFEDEQWRSVFPRDVLDMVTQGGEAYAVPLNIHRTNAIIFDPRALARAEVEPPDTLDDLHRVAEKLRRRGKGLVSPLSIGTRQPWTLSLLAFENILIAIAGPTFYRDLFEGKQSPRAPEVREMLAELGRLLDASNADAAKLGWDEAVDRVRIGSAAMTITGDWAKGYLERRGSLEDADFVMTASPGTARTFVYTMDTFGLPRGARHREGAVDLLRIFGSPHGQGAFNRIKGSLPARSDVLSAPHDAGARKTRLAFEWSTRVPTLTSLAPASFSAAIDAALGDFARDRDAGRVITIFERERAKLGA
jgi:glucose/mannose transport system substrate-binding protein